MSVNRALFSSLTDQWVTPQAVFDRLDAEFHFDLDVCALPGNAKCRRYFTPKQDGLKQEWKGVCWMNPPYGRDIRKWMKKAYESSLRGATVVCLVPARTDTEWWHEYAVKGEIRFIRGRLYFGSADHAAPFPSAIVIFRDKWWERRTSSSGKEKGGDSRRQKRLTATSEVIRAKHTTGPRPPVKAAYGVLLP